ncbi:N-acetyl sugar amidotransferase [Adlercreutzia sp. ZJ138]|uniref:N-acetyl sugar amidotransferase n=1 Tax=Adlercreutzia sp. ZJ138 TaxID=2709405 RepID=UPI0013EDCC06|nr:N-acetyl sugar amidotransferase [Adlercreutzia sp. ZJ138]
MSEATTCTRCVMNDAADPYIRFDESGVCNYCTDAIEQGEATYFPDEDGAAKLETLIRQLKEQGKGKEFDCLMGLSGGLDSSYLAYLGASQWGLRIAAVHIDDGYDTEISKENIRKLCEKSGIRLVVISPDAQQYNALTLAYMRAGVPNLAVPQDNILFAALYDFARKNSLDTFLSGGNYALECILQVGNTWDPYDLVNLRDIQKRFGASSIDKLPFISRYRMKWDRIVLGQKTIRPLNMLDYNRDRAFDELNEYCGFEYYGRKHLENYLTAFLQLCWLPEKFGVDKRTSHLSSMIVSGQMSRDEALRELSEPMCEEGYLARVKSMLCDNMSICEQELEELIHSPGHQHDEYKTDCLRGIWRKIHG